ncbi:MAG: hypothetical protein RR461_03520 [Angelakisella sp.]
MIKRVILTIVTIFSGIAIGVLLALAGRSGGFAMAEPVPETSSSAEASSEVGQLIIPEENASQSDLPGYFIKEYKGRVSVLKDGSEVPEMIFDIQTKLLPELDRRQLSEGIYVETYEELIRLVEDYIS